MMLNKWQTTNRAQQSHLQRRVRIRHNEQKETKGGETTTTEGIALGEAPTDPRSRQSISFDSVKRFGSRLLSGYEAIYDLTTKIGNRSARRLMAYKLLDQRIAVSAIGATTRRKQMLQSYVDYFRNMFPSTLARQARMSVLSLAYVISPELAQQLYLRRTYNQIWIDLNVQTTSGMMGRKFFPEFVAIRLRSEVRIWD
jgi:hypothetical protein